MQQNFQRSYFLGEWKGNKEKVSQKKVKAKKKEVINSFEEAIAVGGKRTLLENFQVILKSFRGQLSSICPKLLQNGLSCNKTSLW